MPALCFENRRDFESPDESCRHATTLSRHLTDLSIELDAAAGTPAVQPADASRHDAASARMPPVAVGQERARVTGQAMPMPGSFQAMPISLAGS